MVSLGTQRSTARRAFAAHAGASTAGNWKSVKSTAYVHKKSRLRSERTTFGHDSVLRPLGFERRAGAAIEARAKATQVFLRTDSH